MILRTFLILTAVVATEDTTPTNLCTRISIKSKRGSLPATTACSPQVLYSNTPFCTHFRLTIPSLLVVSCCLLCCGQRHVFCGSCLKRWAEQETKCPTCRVRFTSAKKIKNEHVEVSSDDQKSAKALPAPHPF